jgi:hypothetical protein
MNEASGPGTGMKPKEYRELVRRKGKQRWSLEDIRRLQAKVLRLVRRK